MKTAKLFLRTDALNVDGTHTVCIRLTFDRKKKDVALKDIKIKLTDWDDAKLRIKKTNPKHYQLNLLVEKYKNKMDTILLNAKLYDKPLNFEFFLNEFFVDRVKTKDFFEFADSELLKYTQKSTIRKVKSQITNLKRFRKTLSFAEITPHFLQSYEHYLKFEKKPNGLNENSCGSNMKMIARMVNAAIQQGIYKGTPVRDMIKIKTGIGNKATVTKDEVDNLFRLLETKSLRPDYNTSLRAFLFACYTGLRIGDLLSITYENFHKLEYAGQTWTMLQFIQNKTKNQVKIPLIDKAYQIYMEFPSAGKKIFNNYSQKKLNEDLKEIIKIARIQKPISFSSSRCSCATILADEGCPDHIIAAILGHKSVNTTRKYYIKTSDESLIKAMEKHYEKKQ